MAQTQLPACPQEHDRARLIANIDGSPDVGHLQAAAVVQALTDSLGQYWSGSGTVLQSLQVAYVTCVKTAGVIEHSVYISGGGVEEEVLSGFRRAWLDPNCQLDLQGVAFRPGATMRGGRASKVCLNCSYGVFNHSQHGCGQGT